MQAALPDRGGPASPRPRLSRNLATLALGVALALATAIFFTCRYPLWLDYSRPLLKFSQVPGSSLGWMTAGWLLMCGLYALAFHLCPGASRGWRSLIPIATVTVALSILMLLTTPIASTDVFEYIARAHVVLADHANPFTARLDRFPGSPYLPYVYWRNVPDNYGVLWHLQTLAVARLVGPGLLPNLVAFKLLVVGYYWAGLPLVFALLRRLRPEHALKGALLYGWNPLLQFDIAGNGHNDALVVVSLLAMLLLLVKGRYTLALLALALGVLVKFVPLVLVPVVLVVLWRDPALGKRAKLRSGVTAGLTAVLLTVLLYLPFGLGSAAAAATNLAGRGGLFGNSPGALVVWALIDLGRMPGPLALFAAGLVAKVVTVDLVVLVLLRLWKLEWGSRQRFVAMAVVGSYEIFFVLLVLTLFFWPWYLAWLFALAPVVARPGYAARAILLSAGTPVIYALEGFFHGSPQAQLFPTALVVAIGFLPALALTIAVWRRQGLIPASAAPPLGHPVAEPAASYA